MFSIFYINNFNQLSFGSEMLNWTICFRVENWHFFPSWMAPFSFIGPIKCNTVTSFSPLFFPLTYNSCHICLPRKLPRNVHVHGNSLSPFSYQSLIHRNLYSERQRGLSLIAFDAKNSESGGEGNQALDAVMKLYSAFKNKDTHELSEILADECRCVCNFLSFFQAFQGKTVPFPHTLDGLNFPWVKIMKGKKKLKFSDKHVKTIYRN